jgi:hypothetical protein
MMAFDYSTINTSVLADAPAVTLAPSYHLQEDPGNGCYLDPPGYPTYFTQCVYTRQGNTPARGPEMVLCAPGLGMRDVTFTWDHRETRAEEEARRAAWWDRLYLPLPFTHPRVKAWVAALVAHFAHCYRNVEDTEYGRPATLIYPVPDYKLKSFTDDPRWSEECRQAAQAEVEAFNRQAQAHASRIATFENRWDVIAIQKAYPTLAMATIDLAISAGGKLVARHGDWWERLAERPTRETCRPPKWYGAHRTSGFCQFCGYVTRDEAAGT